MPQEIKEERQDLIIGRNPVMEALRSKATLDKIILARGTEGGSIVPILEKARALKVPIREVPKQKLDFMCGGKVHQGIAAVIATHEYCEIEDILNNAKQKGKDPFIIICDCIEDPHNLGAIIRTAEACSVDGIIIPKNRAASVNATVAKASSGALMYANIARVTNLTEAIKTLKENGVWVYGADMDGEIASNASLLGPIALVIGSEGHGISRLVKENCDNIISLPMYGKVNSLNASVAAGVLMYEIVRQRGLKN